MRQKFLERDSKLFLRLSETSHFSVVLENLTQGCWFSLIFLTVVNFPKLP